MNPEEFKIKVLPFKHKLFRLSLRMLDRREDAEDIVQDTMLKLWTKRDELVKYSNVEAFAMTVAKNLCIDRIRSKSYRPEPLNPQQNVELQQPPEENLEQDNYRGFINDIIKNLPEQQKAIMQFRDVEGMEYEQIAEIMGLNVNAVRVNLSRARKKVREAILKIQGYELARN
jgi:RNA polymerase sigma-70 factor (ECF subfamily)